MKEAYYTWKRVLRPWTYILAAGLVTGVVSLIIQFEPKRLVVTLVAAPVLGMIVYLNTKVDWYECPKCGHKKGALWM